jgi:hypothetical protein
MLRISCPTARATACIGLEGRVSGGCERPQGQMAVHLHGLPAHRQQRGQTVGGHPRARLEDALQVSGSQAHGGIPWAQPLHPTQQLPGSKCVPRPPGAAGVPRPACG